MEREFADNEMLDRLRKEIERFLSHSFVSPSDFVVLSDTLSKRGLGYVSPTTLKRVWGYINDKGNFYTPSPFTIRVLCNLIGFKDIHDFCNNSESIDSMEYTGQSIESYSLPSDVEVTLLWNPNRLCRLRHIAGARFEVTVNEHSRLRVGDIVECRNFTQFAPVYMRIYRDNQAPFTYVAGSANGVVFNLRGTNRTEQ
ncbi:MAG: hypothetical protein K2M31_02615 [Muribaculaceae bacterium]|nr:hypothetical protein [Muribaculaceae bacterium]